jgi:hypothetical protein
MKRPAPPKNVKFAPTKARRGNRGDGEMHIRMCISAGPAKRDGRLRNRRVVKKSASQKARGR